MMISSRVEHILQQFKLHGSEKPLLIGVSGGPDSLCLLDVLYHLGYPVVIAHLNHGLRPEAEFEAELVTKSAVEMGLKLVLGKEDVFEYARQNKLSIEEAARHIRYTFLFSQASLVGAQAVLVAHTADDQIETLLMHLLRGAGLPGLCGMSFYSLPNPWSQDIPLIRPLLGCWRSEILEYCQNHNLHPALDQSNFDESYQRNHLRHSLIPYLERFNPQVRRVLWNTSQVLAGDNEIIEYRIPLAWRDCIYANGEGFVGFRQSRLMQQTVGMRRRLVRQAINQVQPGLRDVGFETIDNALDFMNNPARTSFTDLAGGLFLLLEGDILWLAAKDADLPEHQWPQVPDGTNMELNIPGVVDLTNGWRLQAESSELESLPLSYDSNKDLFQAWIDGNCIDKPLIIRARRPGDRFQPFGMKNKSVKLSDLMINAKIPRRARDSWPLVCSQDKIVWIPGKYISQQVHVTAGTHNILHLKLSRIV